MTRKNDVVSLLVHLLFLIPYAAAQTDDTAPPPTPNFNFGPVFNPTMAIIMIVLVSAFFSLGFFSVYIRQCAERRIHGGATSDTDLLFGENRRSWRSGRGIGDEVIRTFPTFKYLAVKGLKIGKGELECVVCLNEFEDDETLRLLPKCSHVFHVDCVDAWLSSHNTCPVCRAYLLPRPGETLSSTTVQIFDLESGEPNHEMNNNGRQNPEPITRSPEVNVVSPGTWANQNRPPRIRSTGLRFGGLFSRSHSTGHSLVQPGQNCERFTLRLPEDIWTQIMNSSINLNRARSLGVLPRARSERRGYRSGSTGSGLGRSSSQYERLDRETRPDQWGFNMVQSLTSRTSSVKSTRLARGGEETVDGSTPQSSLLQSFGNQVDQLFLGPDNIGERSTDWLRPNNEA